MSELEYQSEILCNRISKRYKHLKKWANRENITCFRLYDKDIPEIPLAIDLYEGCPINSQSLTNLQFPRFLPADCQKFLVFYLYERPYEKDENEEAKWLRTISLDVATTIGISSENIILKTRKKQKGNSQYQKNDEKNFEKNIIVTEQGQKFIVNLNSYLDTGLFFDHRPLRAIVRESASEKTVLNLYCYTASFSVYAATGKAKSVTSVDLSNTYINWAKKNFALNGFSIDQKNEKDENNEEKYKFITADVLTFLKTDKETYDIIILDPPTFSNSKKTQTDLDINRDWSELVKLCCARLKNDGTLYFSTNSHRLKFDTSLLPENFSAVDISEKTIPEDFRNKKIHRCWKIAVY